MTEQELREKILEVIPTINWCETCKLHQVGNYTREDCITYGKRECAYEKVILDQIHALYKEEGYVKLAKDQGLPKEDDNHTWYKDDLGEAGRIGYRLALEDILKASWRKVEEAK